MLSKGAFNALLKTIEEPKSNVCFIFATTEIHKVPDTIISRCQVFNYRKVPTQAMTLHLEKICKAVHASSIRNNCKYLRMMCERCCEIYRSSEYSLRDYRGEYYKIPWSSWRKYHKNSTRNYQKRRQKSDF